MRAFDKKSLIRILEEAAFFLSLDGKVGLKIMEIIFDNIGLESDMLKLEEEDCWRDFFCIVKEEKEMGEIKFV